MTEDEEYYPCAMCHNMPVYSPGDFCEECEKKEYTCLSCGAEKNPEDDHCQECTEVINTNDHSSFIKKRRK